MKIVNCKDIPITPTEKNITYQFSVTFIFIFLSHELGWLVVKKNSLYILYWPYDSKLRIDAPSFRERDKNMVYLLSVQEEEISK